MMSDARPEPPGLSTRNTIALIDLSAAASFKAFATVSDPID